jgi:hypothetical protein
MITAIKEESKELKNQAINFRVTRGLKEYIEMEAESEKISVGTYMTKLLENHPKILKDLSTNKEELLIAEGKAKYIDDVRIKLRQYEGADFIELWQEAKNMEINGVLIKSRGDLISVLSKLALAKKGNIELAEFKIEKSNKSNWFTRIDSPFFWIITLVLSALMGAFIFSIAKREKK